MGYGGMLPRKLLENLDREIATLVLFAHFLGNILIKFFTPDFESFIKYEAFCSHISIYAC